MAKKEDNLIQLLKETLILKNLSPEKAACFMDCSSRQIRRWFEGVANPTGVYEKIIKEGIRKINKVVPGDTPDGLVTWRAVKISEGEKGIDEKLDVFLRELFIKAGSKNRLTLLRIGDEHYAGFEEIVHLASKLNVKLPEI